MSATRLIAVDANIDISQSFLLKQFTKYLIFNNRSLILINEMKGNGYCVGFTVVAMYAMYLELTQKPKRDSNNRIQARDDWKWLKSALSRLSRWDGTSESLNKKTSASRKLRRDTERLIGLIEEFQNSLDYQPSSQMQLHKHLFDTKGLPFNQEYALAGIFTCAQFTKKIEIPLDSGDQTRITTLIHEVIHENKMVFINSLTHFLGVIKHNKYFYYYDSNSKKGWNIYPEEQAKKLTQAFFCDLYGDIPSYMNKRLPISINVLANDKEKPANYPSQKKILTALGNSKILNSEDGFFITALFNAADLGCRKSVRYYLEHPPLPLQEYIEVRCSFNETALHAAAYGGFHLIVFDLIKAGANPNVANSEDWTPLIYAVESGNVNSVKILLKYGANPNACNVNGSSLLIAVVKQNIVIAKLLLKSEAATHFRTSNGNTALHEAVRCGDLQMVKLLFTYNADVNVKNNHDCSPLYEAIVNKHVDIIEYLLDKVGINVRAKEYNALVDLARMHTSDIQFQRCVLKAQPIYLLNIILGQLETNGIAPHIHHLANLELREVRNEIIRGSLAPREQMILLLQKMVPILRDISYITKKSIWQSLDLAHPVLEFAQQVNLGSRDFRSLERVSVAFNGY